MLRDIGFLSQLSHKFCPEYLTQRFLWEEVLAFIFTAFPFTRGGNATSRHYTMQVRMQPELLSPGMKNSNHGRLGSQVFMVCSKRFNGLPGGREQGTVKFFVIPGQQFIEGMGQSKDNMIVGNRQQFAFPVQDPSFTVGGLALGAMAVAATVITDGLCATVFTDGHMATQGFGPAQCNGLQGLFYLQGDIVLLLKISAMKTDDVGQFKFRLQCFF